jgi:demethylspheroidene O-methyltransferase
MAGLVERTVGPIVDRWRERWVRVLAHPGFQRWAARFPLTRGVARQRATALFDLCAGFVYSQVLHACAQLGVLEALRDRPHDASELAERIGLGRAETERLLDAAIALRLVERRSRGRYGLGIHGASYVGNPAVARMVEHHALLYRDLADPLALLRGEADTELGRFWSYVRGAPDPGTAAAYSTLMTTSLALLAEDVIEAYPFDRHTSVLDVGGGEGVFVEALARAAPRLALTLFDLPAVAERARARLGTAGLGERVRVVGGDVFADPLPRPMDVVSFVRVLHDHDDEAVLAILGAARRALRPGGTLLVAEPMSGTVGAEASGDAYFGFYLLAMGQGRPRTPAQLEALAHRAGFERCELRRTRRPLLARMVTARAKVSK